MQSRKTKQLLTLALMMTLSAVVCQAQTRKQPTKSHAAPAQIPVLPTAKVLALNDDGSYVIEIGGQKFRALNRKQLDDLAKMEVELNGARALNANLEADNKELEQQKQNLTSQLEQERIKFNTSEEKVRSLTIDLAGARGDTRRAFDLLRDEQQLRREAGQFIPHTSGKGFWGKVLDFLDRPEAQATIKLGLPVLNTLRCQQ